MSYSNSFVINAFIYLFFIDVLFQKPQNVSTYIVHTTIVLLVDNEF